MDFHLLLQEMLKYINDGFNKLGEIEGSLIFCLIELIILLISFITLNQMIDQRSLPYYGGAIFYIRGLPLETRNEREHIAQSSIGSRAFLLGRWTWNTKIRENNIITVPKKSQFNSPWQVRPEGTLKEWTPSTFSKYSEHRIDYFLF